MAPFSVQAAHLTLLVREPHNPHGDISSVRLSSMVTPPGQAVGAATARMVFDSARLVFIVNANEGSLVLGQSTLLTAKVVDADGGVFDLSVDGELPGDFLCS